MSATAAFLATASRAEWAFQRLEGLQRLVGARGTQNAQISVEADVRPDNKTVQTCNAQPHKRQAGSVQALQWIIPGGILLRSAGISSAADVGHLDLLSLKALGRAQLGIAIVAAAPD